MYLYEIVDSDFGTSIGEMIDNPLEIVGRVYLAKEYIARNLNVGEALAGLIVQLKVKDSVQYTIEQLCKLQDNYCSHHFDKWNEYTLIRDKTIPTLLILI